MNLLMRIKWRKADYFTTSYINASFCINQSNIDYMKPILVDRRSEDDDKINDEFMLENQYNGNYLILTFDGQVIV